MQKNSSERSFPTLRMGKEHNSDRDVMFNLPYGDLENRKIGRDNIYDFRVVKHRKV